MLMEQSLPAFAAMEFPALTLKREVSLGSTCELSRQTSSETEASELHEWTEVAHIETKPETRTPLAQRRFNIRMQMEPLDSSTESPAQSSVDVISTVEHRPIFASKRFAIRMGDVEESSISAEVVRPVALNMENTPVRASLAAKRFAIRMSEDVPSVLPVPAEKCVTEQSSPVTAQTASVVHESSSECSINKQSLVSKRFDIRSNLSTFGPVESPEAVSAQESSQSSSTSLVGNANTPSSFAQKRFAIRMQDNVTEDAPVATPSVPVVAKPAPVSHTPKASPFARAKFAARAFDFDACEF